MPKVILAMQLFMVSALGLPIHAYAFNPAGRGEVDSLALINKTTKPLTTAESYVIALADPPVASVSGLSISLGYDPSKYTFRSDMSGLLCEFSIGGSCPPPYARYGTYLMADLPAVDLTVGQSLPGSTLSVVNDTNAGVVSVDYLMATPLQLGGEDKNFYAFVFEAAIPYNPYMTTVTFFDQPGNYDFNQISSSCISSEKCGSNTPVYGFRISTVPIPTTFWLFGAGLVGLVSARKYKCGALTKCSSRPTLAA